MIGKSSETRRGLKGAVRMIMIVALLQAQKREKIKVRLSTECFLAVNGKEEGDEQEEDVKRQVREQNEDSF